jgi:hypothetical protein
MRFLHANRLSLRSKTLQKGLAIMKYGLGVFAAAVAAMALLCQSADAGPRRHHHHSDKAKLTAVGVGVGAGMTAAYFGMRDWRLRRPRNAMVSEGGAMVVTTFGCMALSPIVSTVVLQRELTMREAHAMTWDCVIPFVGGWLVNKAFDAHPEWEAKPVRKRR